MGLDFVLGVSIGGAQNPRLGRAGLGASKSLAGVAEWSSSGLQNRLRRFESCHPLVNWRRRRPVRQSCHVCGHNWRTECVVREEGFEPPTAGV